MQTLSDLKTQVEKLKALGARPRVHGNGFIQLDLDKVRRLHIFGDPDIPRQRVMTPIHNHTFGFMSTVYRGALTNLTMDFHSGVEGILATHAEYVARIRDGEDTILVATGEVGQVEVDHWKSFTCGAGASYHFARDDFHMTVEHGPTITVIEKDAPTLAQGGAPPRVLCPVSLKPDNDFNRYQASPSTLWEIILRNF